MQVDTLKVNLRKGSMTISPSERDVVQHVALAFVTTTLYLLVQPRPPATAPAVAGGASMAAAAAAAAAAKRGDKKVWKKLDVQ